MPLYMIVKAMTFAVVVLFSTSTEATIVTDWNNAALDEVRASKLGPPIVARALAIAHTCMYDAWAAYDQVAVGTTDRRGRRRRPVGEQIDANKEQAISFAAYRCLVNLFADSRLFPATAAAAAVRLEAVMISHGYDPTNNSTDPTTPAGIGNIAAHAVIEARSGDASNQYGDLHAGAYSDYTGYESHNTPMAFCTPLMPVCAPLHIDDPDHWQPLIGPPELGSVRQQFVCAHWKFVTPFALTSAEQFDDMMPAPNIFLDETYKKNVDDMLQFSAALDPARKLIVEYWADGPGSELPPGHWGLLAQFVSDRDHHSIDPDVKMFFAMHNASFDAGIVAWHAKRRYDGVRPITAIRYLKQGQMVYAWGGTGRPTEYIPGEKWIPYNPGSNLTPAFPGYISGHSTFSSASAAVLRAYTGSDYFGFSTVIPANFGRVEPGIPAADTPISFATFSEAAQQAGLSRLYGGIHFPEDNTIGQALGALIGQQAWAKAQTYFNGTASQ
jgi:membrane-associated phospholipid phosphatase